MLPRAAVWLFAVGPGPRWVAASPQPGVEVCALGVPLRFGSWRCRSGGGVCGGFVVVGPGSVGGGSYPAALERCRIGR